MFFPILHALCPVSALLLIEPQRHRKHRANFIFVRSGDDDRTKERSPSGRFFRFNVDLETAHVFAERASAEGGGSFPWPPSPGQGKIHLLCVLGVSVVNHPALSLAPFSLCLRLAVSPRRTPMPHAPHNNLGCFKSSNALSYAARYRKPCSKYFQMARIFSTSR